MNTIEFLRFPAQGYATKEAVNTLCTNLSFFGEKYRKIIVTSTYAAEGKSYLAMSIVRNMARLGKYAVLVDTDFRRSNLLTKYGGHFDQPGENPGLAHYLAGMAEEDQVLYRTETPNAFIVPIGREVTNSLPLLNSPRLPQLMDSLSNQFHYVIVDAPPIGTIIDAAQVAKCCDGMLLVVNYNAVSKKELSEVKRQIDQTGCPVLGTVLNQAEMDSYINRKYYYKSYKSHYGYGYDQNEKGRSGSHSKREGAKRR